MKHFLRKLRSTMSILFTLGMARTFGEYVHTAHGLEGEFELCAISLAWSGVGDTGNAVPSKGGGISFVPTSRNMKKGVLS